MLVFVLVKRNQVDRNEQTICLLKNEIEEKEFLNSHIYSFESIENVDCYFHSESIVIWIYLSSNMCLSQFEHKCVWQGDGWGVSGGWPSYFSFRCVVFGSRLFLIQISLKIDTSCLVFNVKASSSTKWHWRLHIRSSIKPICTHFCISWYLSFRFYRYFIV